MKLLLAEDEKELSKALVTLLKMHNYTVDAVFNGEDALDYIECNEYDGIILDIMMPKVDGLTVLKTIRANGNETPIIMLTAKSTINDKCTGLDLGADDYLTKPFSSKELVARIGALCRRKGEIKGSTLTFGDLTLDRTSFELIKGNKKIKLINKEFQILETMMLNPKTIQSVDHLMDKIWEQDKYTGINTVWVYISNIRKKLKGMGSKVTIMLSRNQGYYLGTK